MMTVPINFIKIYFVAIKNFINYILTEKMILLLQI